MKRTPESFPYMAGMTAVSGPPTTFFWIFSSLPTGMLCWTAAISAGFSPASLPAFPPLLPAHRQGRQAAKEHRKKRGRRGEGEGKARARAARKALCGQDDRQALPGGSRPCRKGSVQPRSTKSKFHSSDWGAGTCQQIGFAKPKSCRPSGALEEISVHIQTPVFKGGL